MKMAELYHVIFSYNFKHLSPCVTYCWFPHSEQSNNLDLLNKSLTRRKSFLDYAKQLLHREPNHKMEIDERVSSLNKMWTTLEQDVSGKAMWQNTETMIRGQSVCQSNMIRKDNSSFYISLTTVVFLASRSRSWFEDFASLAYRDRPQVIFDVILFSSVGWWVEKVPGWTQGLLYRT